VTEFILNKNVMFKLNETNLGHPADIGEFDYSLSRKRPIPNPITDKGFCWQKTILVVREGKFGCIHKKKDGKVFEK